MILRGGSKSGIAGKEGNWPQIRMNRRESARQRPEEWLMYVPRILQKIVLLISK